MKIQKPFRFFFFYIHNARSSTIHPQPFYTERSWLIMKSRKKKKPTKPEQCSEGECWSIPEENSCKSLLPTLSLLQPFCSPHWVGADMGQLWPRGEVLMEKEKYLPMLFPCYYS